jgi:hypothetical protein
VSTYTEEPTRTVENHVHVVLMPDLDDHDDLVHTVCCVDANIGLCGAELSRAGWVTSLANVTADDCCSTCEDVNDQRADYTEHQCRTTYCPVIALRMLKAGRVMSLARAVLGDPVMGLRIALIRWLAQEDLQVVMNVEITGTLWFNMSGPGLVSRVIAIEDPRDA